MSNSSLATIQVPAYSGNYTRGRGGRKIQKITIHHMAGHLTAKQCGAIFQRVGRKGSTHYGIGYNGEIAQYIDEANTAWANSNWNSNQISVTLEIANSSTGGQWPINDITLTSVIKLCADIAIRNNLGLLIKGKNLTWHQMYSATTCPGPYLLSKMDYIVQEANKLIAQGTATPDQVIEQPEDFSKTYTKILGYISNNKFFETLNDAKNYSKTQYLLDNYNKYSIYEQIQAFTVNYTWEKDKDVFYPKESSRTELPVIENLIDFNVIEYSLTENLNNPKDSVTSILLKDFKKENTIKEEVENE